MKGIIIEQQIQEKKRMSKRKNFGGKKYSNTSVDELNDESIGEFHSTQEYPSEYDDDDGEDHSDNEDDDDFVDHADDEY